MDSISKDPNVSKDIRPRHKAALDYARAGIPVFPCWPNAKEPAVDGGFHAATTDEAQINTWWGKADYNVAFQPETAGLCVVDLDGAEGRANWERLCAEHGTEPYDTHRVQTPSGMGLHLYFTGSLPGKAGKLAPGVDTRGVASYVLVPPSYVVETKKGYEGPYVGVREPERIDPPEIWEAAPVPAWVTDALAHTEHTPRTAAEGVEIDAPHVIDRGRVYLRGVIKNDGAPVVGSRNNQCQQLAARLGDFGISEDMAVELLEEEWAPHGVAPDEAIEDIARSAYHTRQNDIGCDYQQPGQTDKEAFADALKRLRAAKPGYDPPPAPPAKMTARELVAYDEPVPEDVVDGLLPRQLVTLLYGDGELGKTVLCDHIAIAVAAGLETLFGRRVAKSMPVVMVLCEDRYERIRGAFLAICKHLGIDDPASLPITFRCTPDDPLLAVIDDKGHAEHRPFAEELCKDIAELGECLVILDTVSDIAELNENLRLPPNTLLKKILAPICKEMGATILVTAHPSAAQLHSGRATSGSTAWRNGVRSLLTLKADAENGPRRTLSNRREDGGKASYGNAVSLTLSISGPLFSLAAPTRQLHAEEINKGLLKASISHAKYYAECREEPLRRPIGRSANSWNKEVPGGDGIKQICADNYGFRPSNADIWRHLAHAVVQGYLVYKTSAEQGHKGNAGYHAVDKDASDINDTEW